MALAVPASARPQALVVIADHLTLADVTRPDLPGSVQIRPRAQMALMSPGLAQGPDPIANVYATLGAGDAVRVGDVSQGRMAAALRQAGLRTAVIGDADGDDTGAYRPAALFLPAPDTVAADDGTVADPTAPGGKRIDPARLWAQTQTALRGSDLVVVHFGDFARAERENGRGDLLPSAYAAHRERALRALDQYLGLTYWGLRSDAARPRWLFLVAPTPPLDAQGHWNRLTPLLQWPPRPGVVWHLVARSDTTQTVGLVAARDLAPTVLKALDVTPPLQMTGAVIGRAPLEANTDAPMHLQRLDRQTRLNQQAQLPLFWGLASAGALTLFASLGLYLSGRMMRRGQACRCCCYGLRLLSAWPLALLLAPLTLPATLSAYLGWIAALTALIALLPSPTWIFFLTALVLVGDGLTGTSLVSQSVMSAYALSGIRFYGIGNEYMGVLLAGTLLGASGPPALFGRPKHWRAGGPPIGTGDSSHGSHDKDVLKATGQSQEASERKLPAPPPFRLGGLLAPDEGGGGAALLAFALVTFVLSFPEFGAKAGGAVTATATFTVAYLRLRGRAVTWKHLAGSLAAGFLLVFVWALVGHWLGSRRTHIESAVDALFGGRFGYIAGVAWRKVGLATRVFLYPGTLLGVLAFAGLGWVLRVFLMRQVRGYLRGHPPFAAVWGAGLWGCLVALFVNDSGIVAALLLLTCLLLALLHGMYQECESLPSTSGTSESVSPSVTPSRPPPSPSGR